MKNKININRIVFAICIFGMCIADQIIGSLTGRIQMAAIVATEMIICIMAISTYHIKDFLKPIYYVWLGLAVTVLPIIGIWRWSSVEYKAKFVSILIFFGIYGFILIRTILHIVEKKREILNDKNLLVLMAIALFFVLAMLSRNDGEWYWYFAAILPCFYLTDMDRKTKNAMVYGITDGVILGFFVVQGQAWCFRPFDTPRYFGMYANENINALFYLAVHTAVMVRLTLVFDNKRKKTWMKIISSALLMLLGCAMYSFAFLTGGRTAIGAMLLVDIMYIFCICIVAYKNKYKKKGIVAITLNCIGLVVLSASMLPVVFWSIRYLPTYTHHPVWYEGEYREERVQSFDPSDSEKYTDWEECVKPMLERILPFLDSEMNKVVNVIFPPIVAKAQEIDEEKINYVLGEEYVDDSVLIRKAIYSTYLSRLNILGHKNAENVVYVIPQYTAPHAHNVFLQEAFDYGIIAGVIFGLVYVGAIAIAIINVVRGNRTTGVVCLLFTVAFGAFGMFEYVARAGQFMFNMYFILLYFAIDKGRSVGKK